MANESHEKIILLGFSKHLHDKNLLGFLSDTIHTRVEQSNLDFSVMLPIVQF
jgi:hypothetical protein